MQGGSPDHDRSTIARHRSPPWFEDAKLGIFVHWGLYSVPGWAPKLDGEGGFAQIARALGRGASPYAEWYWNSLRTPGSPTARHHFEHHGNTGYEEFRDVFETMLEAWDPEPWADLFAAAGARYVVLTTKHHDGFLLWPSQHRNPHRRVWQTDRDVVGELAAAVRRRGMRFGAYYSGGLDWTFVERPVVDLASVYGTVPTDATYRAYTEAHFRELIDRYEPDVLWNDIGLPPGFSRDRILVEYLERVPNGTFNDRFRIVPRNAVRALGTRAGRTAANTMAERLLASGALSPKISYHADFTTPEYATEPEIRGHKWETCRGMGHSFGYNRSEGEADHVAPEELIRGFIDAVSKNGNLLLNVGPRGEDGVVPTLQAERLRALGDWLGRNESAVRGTRPWTRAEGRTDRGHDVRFTQAAGSVFATVFGNPAAGPLRIDNVPVRGPAKLLGHSALNGGSDGRDLCVDWPDGLEQSAAHSIRVGPSPRTMMRVRVGAAR